MENEKKEKNISSGAEKVENVAERAEEKADGYAVKKSKKTPSQKKKEREKREKARAKKRVDAALLKQERKNKKAAAKEERKKRKMELKAKAKAQRAERKAEREKRRTLLKSESKEQRAKRLEKERAARVAERKAEKERAYALKLERKDARLKKREQRLKDRQHRRENRRTPGFGGWLAAVIALGATSLVLASVLTFGAMNLSRTNAMLGAGYRGTVYELTAIVDEMDEDLSKARISSSGEEQSRVLTDLLVRARVAESALEKLPLTAEQDRNLTVFLNRTAKGAERMLESIRENGKLSEKESARLQELYEKHHEVRATLDELISSATEKDWKDAFKKGESAFQKGVRKIESLSALEPFPKPPMNEERAEALSSNAARELCDKYFADYAFKKVELAGETVRGAMRAYNFFLTDENGTRAFAQITDEGKLLSFEYYAPCKEARFDGEQSLAIAEKYLKAQGYNGLVATFASETGAEVDFTFVLQKDGVLYYPKRLQVKVCKERGVVSGLDASKYLREDRGMVEMNVKISEDEAQAKLHKDLTVVHSALAVLPCRGRNVLAYEFVCEYEGKTYFIYLNAQTGEETEIRVVENTAQGKFLR